MEAAEPGASVPGVLKTARRHPSGILLFAQLAAVLLYPFMEGNAAGRAIFSAFGIGFLALVVMAVRSTPVLLWVSFIFALPATVLLLIQAVTKHDRRSRAQRDPRSPGRCRSRAWDR